jgi:hypothetical protein
MSRKKGSAGSAVNSFALTGGRLLPGAFGPIMSSNACSQVGIETHPYHSTPENREQDEYILTPMTEVEITSLSYAELLKAVGCTSVVLAALPPFLGINFGGV